MANSHARRPLPLVIGLLAASLALPGCKGGGDVEQVAGPDKLYSAAAQDLRANNFRAAIQKLESLESHYPFTNAAKQGQLDLMFAYYRNKEAEAAIDQADQFMRENPTHPRVDYAHYIQGLVYFDSGADWLAGLFHADTRKRPPHEARKSLQAFQVLLQRYPKSPYAADARQRAVFLRNRLADYELAVAEYYVKREAYVAAVNRARSVIENYDGSPAALKALGIMSEGYRQLGLDDLAKVADSVYETNRNMPDIVGPAAASAGLSAGQTGGAQSTGGAYTRAGRWEARAGLVYGNSSTTDFKGGTQVDVDSGVGFVGGAEYHFTDHLSAGASLSYDSKDYTADAATDTPGETVQIKGSMDTTSLMVNGTYNFMAGRFTPLITGGVGWTWVDTNIVNAPPDVGCWWNPWYGYICTSSPNTKTTSGLAYELGVGMRYEFNNFLAADGIYKMKWVGFDNANGTPSFDGFQMNLGWKF